MSEFKWLGSESGAHSYLTTIADAMKKYGSIDGQPSLYGARDEDLPDNPIGYDVNDGVAVISVSGGMANRSTWFTRWVGIPTYQDIRERFGEAAADEKVNGVLFHLDTSGGMAEGCRATASFVRQFNNKVKPVIGFTDSKALSAGYWLIAASQQIVADQDAELGSIGAIVVFMEYTEMMKNMGITPKVFRSAPHKAPVTPYEKLSDIGSKTLQDSIDRLHTMFTEGIADLRDMKVSVVKETIANGKVYPTKEALKLNMVDKSLSFEQAVAKISAALKK